MTEEERGKYLKADKDILDDLATADHQTSGLALEERKNILSKAQIKAVLRSRKQAEDSDRTNRRPILVLHTNNSGLS